MDEIEESGDNFLEDSSPEKGAGMREEASNEEDLLKSLVGKSLIPMEKSHEMSDLSILASVEA